MLEKLEGLELEVEERVGKEREKIKEDALKTAEEKHKHKEREWNLKLERMNNQIEELKRKAEQGSGELQGEAFELELEAALRSAFPHDIIEPVPKGLRGADIIQKVYGPTGQHCGDIIWESKRTKAWSDGWINKLKDDQRKVGADIAVITSTTMPKEVTHFTCSDGVWITCCETAVGLAAALRGSLIQVAQMKMSLVGKNEKMEMLYGYLSGPEFRQRVEGIVESFVSMKKDLEKEKRATVRTWAKRSKQIERVMLNTARMYGDMQGIIGSSLPELKELEMKAIAEGSQEEEQEGELTV